MSSRRSAYCAIHFDIKNDCRSCDPGVKEACWTPTPNPLTMQGIKDHAELVEAALDKIGPEIGLFEEVSA